MTKEEAAIKQELLEGAVDELNSTLLADCKDKIGKDSGQEMIEELKEASVEIDQDDEFTKATADVLRALGVKAKFKVKKEKKKKN